MNKTENFIVVYLDQDQLAISKFGELKVQNEKQMAVLTMLRISCLIADKGLNIFQKQGLNLKLVFSKEKKPLVRKHCEFWEKVFKKLTFLIKKINHAQTFNILKIKQKRHQITSQRIATMQNIMEYITLFKKLDTLI